MTSLINHRAEAEKHLATASRYLFKIDASPSDTRTAEIAAAIGQAHATLAAGGTADDDLRTQLHGMRHWVSGHIAHALVSGDIERWKAAFDLAKGLDSADNNIDQQVDEHLADDGHNPKDAWLVPARIEETDERWGPGVTAVQAANNVVALHLAEALLDSKSSEVRDWAHGLMHELRREGFDLTGDIGRHIQRMALGRLEVQVPF
jgi:hypothetical protein